MGFYFVRYSHSTSWSFLEASTKYSAIKFWHDFLCDVLLDDFDMFLFLAKTWIPQERKHQRDVNFARLP